MLRYEVSSHHITSYHITLADYAQLCSDGRDMKEEGKGREGK